MCRVSSICSRSVSPTRWLPQAFRALFGRCWLRSISRVRLIIPKLNRGLASRFSGEFPSAEAESQHGEWGRSGARPIPSGRGSPWKPANPMMTSWQSTQHERVDARHQVAPPKQPPLSRLPTLHSTCLSYQLRTMSGAST